MKKSKDVVLSLANDPTWVAELERLERRIARVRAVANGDARVERHWREGYKEKKIRTVRGHYVHRVVFPASKAGDKLRAQLTVLKGGKK